MQKNLKLRPLLPFSVIFILMVIAYICHYFYPFSWASLKSWHMSLKNFAELHPIQTPLLFMGIYILYALFSLPGIFVLSLIAGCLFTQPFSTLYPTIAATIGATLLFLTARTAFGQFFYRKAGQRLLDKLEHGFRENAASYLLFLRFIPLFPFFIVNVAGAFFKVPFWVFVWTTFVGMIPSVFVYAQAGRGLAMLLHSPNPLNPANLFNFHLIIALIGLALLALVPVLFKYFKLNF
jgi:uncharacterized membrane protein YdjX (TVP38/TMEM64 family)